MGVRRLVDLRVDPREHLVSWHVVRRSKLYQPPHAIRRQLGPVTAASLKTPTPHQQSPTSRGTRGPDLQPRANGAYAAVVEALRLRRSGSLGEFDQQLNRAEAVDRCIGGLRGYDGSDSRWSTDHKRQKLFDEKGAARPVCQQLRKLCPRNAKVINIEDAR
jgi:hypothetical protein